MMQQQGQPAVPGGITVEEDGTIIAAGPSGILTYQLTQARIALRLEINTGMIAARGNDARTIIPWLVRQGITAVQPPYTRKRKVQAWNDLNAWMTAHGFEPMTLERAPRRAREGQ